MIRTPSGPSPDPAGFSPRQLAGPVHCPMLAVDITAFGRRDPDTQQHVRDGLYRIVEKACNAARIQLRMAIHAGYIRGDRDGVSGCDLIHLFRLMDAPSFKTRLQGGRTEFALITSDYLYNQVLQHGTSLLEPDAYRSITVTNKETRTPAWVWLSSATNE